MKLLQLILFTITITLSVQAVEFDKTTATKLNQMGVYFGNPLENIIIGQGDMYLVIHNPAELALTVMDQEAKNYCRQTLGNNFTSNFKKILGRYTVYFSCEIQNKIDQYNLSDREKQCIEDRSLEMQSCSEINKKNTDIINTIEIQTMNEEKYKTHDFVYSIKTKFYDQIETHEQIAENNRINRKIQKNIDICKRYNFEEGSKDFNQCLLHIISLEVEKEKN